MLLYGKKDHPVGCTSTQNNYNVFRTTTAPKDHPTPDQLLHGSDYFQSSSLNEILHVHLSDIPGGPDAFELAAKFCYGVRLKLTATNAVDFGEENLIACTEGFLNQVVLQNWKECTRALCSCESVLIEAKELGIVNMCIDAVVMKACTDPNLLAWPMPKNSMQSPGGSFLWNGISTGQGRRSLAWYEDNAMLSLPLYKRVNMAMESQGLKSESVAGALMHFARS
ncbi:hypothetical protein GOP47_0013222 [Adiantum capillus-veneris]|uniref:NPH3 domain-containing protein n=1 Tax=Adiantum capillus-veneris TaxID=13818 RepID=A0A9D4UNB2_ADICA|nr:hypothetical protein GOP47_0013222 [Adiantum capillus-veneris]